MRDWADMGVYVGAAVVDGVYGDVLEYIGADDVVV